MRRTNLAALLVIPLAALPACLSVGGDGAPPIRRHSVDLPPQMAREFVPRLPPIVVRQFAARGRYEPRVVVVDGPGRVAFLDLDRWVEEPAEAVTTFVRERLAASGLFEAVAASSSEMQTELVLDGVLLAFDVVRSDSGPWRAHLALRLEVTERSTGRMVHAAAYRAARDLPAAAATGLGAALGECLEEAVSNALAAWGAAPDTDVAVGR